MSNGKFSRVNGLVSAIALVTLGACGLFPTDTPDPDPRPPVADTGPLEPSAESEALTRYYTRLQSNLQAQDLLRADGGGVDTPYSNTDIAKNFERIAFYDEFAVGQGLTPGSGQPSRMIKWKEPVRMSVEFGRQALPEQRENDPDMIDSYVKRLTRITGHPITLTDRNPNFHVIIAGEDDKDDTIARFLEIEPNMNQASVNIIRNLNRKTACFVFTFAKTADDSVIHKGIALIRAELPDLMRRACVHEELAQGLGLRNDSATARPSIFNDDEEFALLTSHDEALLRLLYHPSLKPGMSLNQARPLIKRILDGNPGQI
ncbi:MAG: DUF2927 domain-containing protein [Pseudomonadota bacterium]